MLRLGIDPEKLYGATFICQYGLCCCNMALISFRLFRKNLGNLRDFFRQMVYRLPWQKISRTPMIPLKPGGCAEANECDIIRRFIFEFASCASVNLKKVKDSKHSKIKIQLLKFDSRSWTDNLVIIPPVIICANRVLCFTDNKVASLRLMKSGKL